MQQANSLQIISDIPKVNQDCAEERIKASYGMSRISVTEIVHKIFENVVVRNHMSYSEK